MTMSKFLGVSKNVCAACKWTIQNYMTSSVGNKIIIISQYSYYTILFIHNFSTKYILGVKFYRDYEKNMSFLVVSKSPSLDSVKFGDYAVDRVTHC